MASTDWDTTVPANSDQLSAGDDTIRDLKGQLALRNVKEHVAYATSSAGGEHKEGSAMVYYATAAASLTRPNGDAFTSADEGRIRFNSDDQLIRVYSGSAWVTAGYVGFNDGVNHSHSATIGIKTTNTGSTETYEVNVSSNGIGSEYNITGSASGKAIKVNGSSTGAGSLVQVDVDSGSQSGIGIHNEGSAVALNINQDGAGNAIAIDMDTAATGKGVSVALNDSSGKGVVVAASASADDNLFHANNLGDGVCALLEAKAGGNCLNLACSGTKSHINMSGDPANSSSADGDFWFDGSNFKVNIAGTVSTIDVTGV